MALAGSAARPMAGGRCLHVQIGGGSGFCSASDPRRRRWPAPARWARAGSVRRDCLCTTARPASRCGLAARLCKTCVAACGMAWAQIYTASPARRRPADRPPTPRGGMRAQAASDGFADAANERARSCPRWPGRARAGQATCRSGMRWVGEAEQVSEGAWQRAVLRAVLHPPLLSCPALPCLSWAPATSPPGLAGRTASESHLARRATPIPPNIARCGARPCDRRAIRGGARSLWARLAGNLQGAWGGTRWGLAIHSAVSAPRLPPRAGHPPPSMHTPWTTMPAMAPCAGRCARPHRAPGGAREARVSRV